MNIRQRTLRKHIPLTFAVTPTDNYQDFSVDVPFDADEFVIKYVTFADDTAVAPLTSVDKAFNVRIPTLITSNSSLCACPVNLKGYQSLHMLNLSFPFSRPTKINSLQKIVLFTDALAKPNITGTFTIGLEFIKYLDDTPIDLIKK